MKILSKNLLILSLFCIVVAGCGRVGYQDKREQKSKIMLKAYAMSNAGDYDSAIALFKKTVEAYPSLARPHLDVALLLQDYKHDYMRAIYHYNRYLEMRPASEKADMIGARIKQAERAFVTRHMSKEKTFGLSQPELVDSNRLLEKKNTSLKKKIKALEAELAGVNEIIRQQYRESVVGEDDDVKSDKISELPQLSLPETSEESPDPPVVRVLEKEPMKPVAVATDVIVPPLNTLPPVKPIKVSVKKPEILTYTVKPGDTLSRIAYEVYGDATQWRKIQKANQDMLGTGVNVKAGQVLDVPAP